MYRILFVCTHNSARSQMAEGLLRAYAGHLFDVTSAGTEPGKVHPLAIAVMAENRIDISQQRSKSVEQVMAEPFDYVVTVCDQARESCPVFPGPAQRIHWSFPDPSAVQGSKGERLVAFRTVRDEIAEQITGLISALTAEKDGAA